MFAAIIPFSHTHTLDPITYSVPEIWIRQITLWGLVSIPYGNHIDTGIVVGISALTVHIDVDKIRPIEAVYSSTPLIAPYQIDMIASLSHRYMIPPHKVLRMFLPTSLMSRLDKRGYVLDIPATKERTVQTSNNTILYFRDTSITDSFFSDILTTWSSAIVFPDDYFLLSHTDTCSSQCTLLLSESTPVQKNRCWIEATEWKIERFVWTRRLLYYNLTQFSHLYYIEDAFGDEDFSYPVRLRTLDILRAFADHAPLPITIVTSTPTLELFAKFRDFKLHQL